MFFEESKNMIFTTAKTKSLGWIGIFLFLFGLVFFGASMVMLVSTQQKIAIMSKTTGKVVQITSYRGSKGGTLYTPVVSFTDQAGNGQRFSPNSGSNPATHSVDDEVSVFYDPAGIEEPILDHWSELWLLPGIFGLVGGIIGVVGGLMTFSQLKREKALTWLHGNGQQIESTYSDVRLETGYKSNGQSPYVVQSQWLNPSTGEVIVFESDYLWFNPEQFLTEKQTITVKIDPQNPSKTYSMDTSFLPKKG